MKNFTLIILFWIFLFPIEVLTQETHQPCQGDKVPFTTGDTWFKKWDGQQYQPFFTKGINLGVAVPGTFPSQMAASRKDYIRWISMMREAGFNNIRIYTLHFPHFYEVLDSINRANPRNPIHIFHGVWLEEELPGYENDLYQLNDVFTANIEEIIDVVHGNRNIPERLGMAYGNYTTDISEWVMGYIIGREVHPAEVITTEELHPDVVSYAGQAISLPSGTPVEAWVAARMDHTVMYSRNNYGNEHPVSFSSWPTLDPLHHPTETTDEDIAHFDVTKFDYSNAPAGIFATYHAYPYYPRFISHSPFYQTYFDYLGPNSYLGYLTDLKNYYHGMPLIIGEFGTSSSWGIAQFAQNGITHGGMDELDQGMAFMRMMETVLASGCGGGMMFSWIDEWFKRTWITDNFDYDPNRRILWHNVTAAEQNFGLLGFSKPDPGFTTIHEDNCADCPVQKLEVKADYSFFHMKMGLQQPLNHQDTVWVALDTYASSLGESVLPGGHTVSNRAEYAIRITQYSAELYVTQAYDLYGIWHGISGPEQLYRSIATDGAPWKMVRWKTNEPEYEVHYIGQLKVRRADLPPSSLDGVIIGEQEISIRLPWSLINFHDPSQLRAVHDYRNVPGRQDTLSDGILPMVFYKDFSLIPQQRWSWESWNQVLDVQEVVKKSYEVIKVRLPFLNNPPIAMCMEFNVMQNLFLFRDAKDGLLSEAIDFDGGQMQVYLKTYPMHGTLEWYADGSFYYTPDVDYIGDDVFSYSIFDGRSFSEEMTVGLKIFEGTPPPEGFMARVYPNPATRRLHIALPGENTPATAYLMSITGQPVKQWSFSDPFNTVYLSGLSQGTYLLRIQMPESVETHKIIVTGE